MNPIIEKINCDGYRGWFFLKKIGYLRYGKWKTLYLPLNILEINNRGPNYENTWWVPERFYVEKNKKYWFIYCGPLYIEFKRLSQAVYKFLILNCIYK